MGHYLCLVFVPTDSSQQDLSDIAIKVERLLSRHGVSATTERYYVGTPRFDLWSVGGQYHGMLGSRRKGQEGQSSDTSLVVGVENTITPVEKSARDTIEITIHTLDDSDYSMVVPAFWLEQHNQDSTPSPRDLLGNMCPVAELPDDCIPAAVVTPDGQWHTEFNEESVYNSNSFDPYWEDKYEALRSIYGEYLAVAIDCHI